MCSPLQCTCHNIASRTVIRCHASQSFSTVFHGIIIISIMNPILSLGLPIRNLKRMGLQTFLTLFLPCIMHTKYGRTGLPLHVLDGLSQVNVVVIPSNSRWGEGNDAAAELDALSFVGHLVLRSNDKTRGALAAICTTHNRPQIPQ